MEVDAGIWELHSSDSHAERHDVELALDVCDAASEKTDEVEEEAEEERGVVYGWVSGRTPKWWGWKSRLMLKEICDRRNTQK